MLNLGILISGRGSNMEAILKAVRRKKIPARPALVLSNKPDAAGLAIAEKLGVRTAVVESRGMSRAEYDRKAMAALAECGVTPRNGLVCLAGFMRIIGPQFVKRYKNRILNMHPALLPAFPGLDAQAQALRYGAKYTGCTVHFVDAGVDTGPVIAQAAVKIMPEDTADTLSRRILRQEHRIYPMAVELFARKRIRISGKKAIVKSPARQKNKRL
ncbi:MAG: phosphoribosylglycinamide formyltransferase [Nitrosopumilus sp. H13]|nr:MAG: phosphoribosylglycinamide formyltransferase [Nitrosopumilus sp. H13]